MTTSSSAIPTRAGDRLEVRQGGAADEDTHESQQPARRCVQESLAPVQGGAHRALAGREVARTGLQRRVEPLQQRRGIEQPRPGGGELEGEGQPGEALAGGADGRGVGRVRAPPGVDPLRAIEQQPRRGGGRPVRVVVHLERLHGVLRLAAHAQRRAAGGQDGQVGHGLDDRGDVRRGVEQVLDVVQHEEQVLAAQPVDDVVGDGPRRVAGGGHGVGDRREQLARLQERRELDQAYAVRVAVADRRRCGQGQAGLAHAAGAAEGDQAARAQEVGDAADVVVATDERRGRDRQVAPAGGAVRRRGRRGGAR